MRRRSDEEIQAHLDQGRDEADAVGWEREELIDLRAYALIDDVFAEQPEIVLTPDFADTMTDRLMPEVVAWAERLFLGMMLAAFAFTGMIVAIGSLPLVLGTAGRLINTLAEYGRPDVAIAVVVMLLAIALMDRLLPSVGQRARDVR